MGCVFLPRLTLWAGSKLVGGLWRLRPSCHPVWGTAIVGSGMLIMLGRCQTGASWGRAGVGAHWAENGLSPPGLSRGPCPPCRGTQEPWLWVGLGSSFPYICPTAPPTSPPLISQHCAQVGAPRAWAPEGMCIPVTEMGAIPLHGSVETVRSPRKKLSL